MVKGFYPATLIAFAMVFALGLAACTTASTSDREETREETRKEAKVPAGTVLRVVLQQGVGTDSSDPGNDFTALLADPVVVDGRTVLEKGSSVVGSVVDVQKAGRVKGRATLRLALTSVVRDGKTIPIRTRTYVGVAKANKKRDAAVIGGAAGVGAVIGAIAGGGKGAATGAAIGGAGGTGTVLATRGDDLHYPPESRLTFVLSNAVDL